MSNYLKDALDMGELQETVALKLADRIDYEELADDFLDKYEGQIYELILNALAEDIIGLPF